jgi:hypothetical protein
MLTSMRTLGLKLVGIGVGIRIGNDVEFRAIQSRSCTSESLCPGVKAILNMFQVDLELARGNIWFDTFTI